MTIFGMLDLWKEVVVYYSLSFFAVSAGTTFFIAMLAQVFQKDEE